MKIFGQICQGQALNGSQMMAAKRGDGWKWLLALLVAFLLLSADGAIAAAGERAPSFSLADFDGRMVSSDLIYGKQPALLMFWATW